VSVEDAQEIAAINEVSHDLQKFLEEYCKLKPYWYLRNLIESYEKYQFNAVRWPRQTGKSTCIAALHLADAWNNADLNVGFVGPSWRQSKLNIRRVASFCRNLPQESLHIQKTRITLPNGSVIEAFPNNPDTIRGNTFHRIWWDEVNFTSNDEDLYDAILFTLGTTNGKLTASSTPFNTDSLFWKMCNHKYYADFGRLHFSYEKALEPEGPLKQAIVDKIKRQFGDDPARWRREMEAEWAEDEDVWLSQSLIASCIGTTKNCGEDLQPWNDSKGYQGDLFAGLDLAQVRDYCVFSVFNRVNDLLLLRH
jgi:phage FluMu gp28-like protein